MNISKLRAFILLTAVSGCAPIGHQFCLGNGYAKGTAGYEQCTLRYQSSADLYQYCATTSGLVAEGPALNQCVANARQIKNVFTIDASACQNDANVKFAPIFGQQKHEKQPTLRPNGTVSVDEIPTPGGYSSDEMDGITAPYIQQCLQAYGWGNGTWQGGKTPTSMSSTTSRLTMLNQQPVTLDVPAHATVRLFQAVSQGDLYGVKNIITQEGLPVNIQNYQGYSALHIAARQGNFPIVQMLIEELHADTELRSNRGENAIAMAARSPNPSVATYISDILRRRDAERIRHEEDERRRRELKEIKRAIQDQQKAQPQPTPPPAVQQPQPAIMKFLNK